MRWVLMPMLAHRLLRGCVALLAAAALAAGATGAERTALPEIRARIVDEAGLLSTTATSRLTRRLAAHEQASSEQVVVVTVASLGGRSIEEAGVELGRKFGIGTRERNNGVLFILAPNERRVRIEVGYGLEGTLTDAACSTIINALVLPPLRSGDFEAGIVAGVEGILSTLGGTLEADREAPPRAGRGEGQPSALGWVFFAIWALLIIGAMTSRGRRGRVLRGILPLLLSGGFDGRRGGGFGGGGFRGGGGSFGGGGASGSW